MYFSQVLNSAELFSTSSAILNKNISNMIFFLTIERIGKLKCTYNVKYIVRNRKKSPYRLNLMVNLLTKSLKNSDLNPQEEVCVFQHILLILGNPFRFCFRYNIRGCFRSKKRVNLLRYFQKNTNYLKILGKS